MFDLEKVHSLNDLEMIVYQYLLENTELIPTLTIRQLSTNSHVSTSTILRFCAKMGFDGFSELKYNIKKNQIQNASLENYYDRTIHVDSFLKKINCKNYDETLKPAIDLIKNASPIIFSGMSTSGILGNYGSRYFSNMGINAHSLLDPYTPIHSRGMEQTLAIILSVSGETNEMLKQVSEFKQAGAKVLSITNNEHSTLSRLADYNISYYMPEEHSLYEDPHINITTQIPVIALLELLAHQVSQDILIEKKQKQEPST